MEDTIIALLNNNLRVIIPDFGAFIIRQRQPRIIVFNEFLRYNDGILIDFIVKTEGIDREIAEQRVADFAEDGTKLLASGREMVIEGLGTLKKVGSGKISFIEAPEIIEIESKETIEPEIRESDKTSPNRPTPVPEEDSGNSGIPEQEMTERRENTEPVKQAIPAKPKSKTAGRPKSKEKKAPPKIKSARIIRPSAKSLPPDVTSRAIEPPSADLQTSIEAAPVEPEIALEAAPIEPEIALETAPIGPEIILDAAPVEPEIALEAAPVEKQEAIEAAPVEPEIALEAAPVEKQEALEAAPVEASIKAAPVFMQRPVDDAVSESGKGTPSAVSTNRILAWVLIILFVNAGILAWFVFRNKTKRTSPAKTVTTLISDTLYDRLADSVRAAAMDSSVVYAEAPVEPDAKSNLTEDALAPGSRYYIVAGCFRDEINADSLVTSLKLLGYKAEKFGKIGNLFAVCFASFDNKDKAVSELKRIRAKVPSAWMTKF
jgi:nucleoid DNA-binding protein